MANESDLLRKMHDLLIESLRSREQEVFKYLGILVPALGGFGLLVYVTVWPPATNRPPTPAETELIFILGSTGVLLLLFLGTIYSLALGYNFRYITLELAKIEARLGITAAMLRGWPKSPCKFLKYRYCLPPEVIKYFWAAFVGGIAFVTVSACVLNPECLVRAIVLRLGLATGICGVLAPFYFGWKLRRYAKREITAWNEGEWNSNSEVVAQANDISTTQPSAEEINETLSIGNQRLRLSRLRFFSITRILTNDQNT
jgi:hypothetical protein